MEKNLIIVESPNKIKKIKGFLKERENKDVSFDVISSVGHIRDLDHGGQFGLGIDLDQMKPRYKNIQGKNDVINNLNSSAKKSTTIFLATDPDREGESIAWHIKEVIKDNTKGKKIKRIVFNEISKNSILYAIDNPRELNNDLLDSQESRRMLDRIIGFRLSYITRRKLSAPSAGRVKSALLKLIIERENEIKKFVAEKWWTIEHEIEKNDVLTNVDDKKFNLIKYQKKDEANNVLKTLNKEFKFYKQFKKEKTVNPPRILEMSSYLMAVYSNFGYSNAKATMISQKLYEEGLITYPRTDSQRLSNEFISIAKSYIEKKWPELYRGVVYKPKKNTGNIQDAHEGIRPVDINLNIDDLKIGNDEKKVYKLILSTTIKSLMKPGKNFNLTNIYINNEKYFSRKFSKPSFLGFREVDGSSSKIDIKELEKKDIKLKTANDIKVVDHESSPPPRYNQSSIIKKMKEEGIGRPSTYSSTVSGLTKYNYLILSEKQLIPTELGLEVNKLLQENFKDIVNEKYTKKMEESLDEIAHNSLKKIDYLENFWRDFEPRIEEANVTIEKKLPDFVEGRKCPNCGSSLVYKWGRFGKFIGCSSFPGCNYIENMKKTEYVENRKCPQCDSKLVYRYSKRRSKNNKFIGCSNFPNCKFIEKIEKE